MKNIFLSILLILSCLFERQESLRIVSENPFEKYLYELFPVTIKGTGFVCSVHSYGINLTFYKENSESLRLILSKVYNCKFNIGEDVAYIFSIGNGNIGAKRGFDESGNVSDKAISYKSYLSDFYFQKCRLGGFSNFSAYNWSRVDFEFRRSVEKSELCKLDISAILADEKYFKEEKKKLRDVKVIRKNITYYGEFNRNPFYEDRTSSSVTNSEFERLPYFRREKIPTIGVTDEKEVKKEYSLPKEFLKYFNEEKAEFTEEEKAKFLLKPVHHYTYLCPLKKKILNTEIIADKKFFYYAAILQKIQNPNYYGMEEKEIFFYIYYSYKNIVSGYEICHLVKGNDNKFQFGNLNTCKEMNPNAYANYFESDKEFYMKQRENPKGVCNWESNL